VFQLSSVSMHYFRKKLSVCRRLNDFQDWILSTSRILYECLRWWPRFTVVKPRVKMATHRLLRFCAN